MVMMVCVCSGSGCIVKMRFGVGFESMGVVFLELIMEEGGDVLFCCLSQTGCVSLLAYFSCLRKRVFDCISVSAGVCVFG